MNMYNLFQKLSKILKKELKVVLMLNTGGDEIYLLNIHHVEDIGLTALCVIIIFILHAVP